MKSFLLLIVILLPFVVRGQNPWVAPIDSRSIENPFEGKKEALIKGEQLFELLCIVCHGETGQGDGVTLEYLNPKPANLTSEKVQAQTAGEMYWKITTGRPPMQSYADVLSRNEIWTVVSYIRTLKEE